MGHSHGTADATPACVGRLVIVVVMLATGCRDVLDIADVDPRAFCFRDGFDAPAIDRTRWEPMDDASPVTLAIAASGLVIAAPPGIVAENGILLVDPLDLTDGTLQVRVHTVTAPDALETFFLVFTGPDSGFGFVTSEGDLVAREFVNGAVTDARVAFDPQDVLWRVRHRSSDRTVTFEISADAVAWTTLRVLGNQSLPVAVRPRLQAGVYSPVNAAPRQAVFDTIEQTGDSCITASAD
jgi:hypothetical protein